MATHKTGVLGLSSIARSGPESLSPPGGSRALEVERRLVRCVLHGLGDPAVQIGLWDGSRCLPAGTMPRVGMVIRDRSMLWRFLANPDLNFATGYCEGRIDMEGDLVDFADAVYRARVQSAQAGKLWKRALQWLNRPRGNTLSDARQNIHHHYDIGNDFYRLWLDAQLSYTCAYFPEPETTLEAAQAAKMDLVCRKLNLQPGETVVEAGCGWGALARYMAQHYGVRVKAYNISREQIQEARAIARRDNLADRVEYIEDDYRAISGTFDAFVSVGMLEHVGVSHYSQLGDLIDHVLTPAGRGLIHTIGQDAAVPLHPWIEQHIFPGAYPPTLREMAQIFEPHRFTVLDVENLRLHYAKTLEHWLAGFERNADLVREMFDEPFVRAWRLYLAGSLAAFLCGTLQLFQVTFAREGNNAIPWTRRHLYRADAPHEARRGDL